jgi:hypothetical protein
MSFTVGSLSTGSSLTFGPSRVDIAWDGKSDGKVSFMPSCSHTAATYSITVRRVFPSDTNKTVYVSNNSATVDYFAGEPYVIPYDPAVTASLTFYTYPEFSIGHTANTSGVVAFELNPANTNYTQKSSAETLYTTRPMYYSWEMKQTKGTATQIVALGKITRRTPNPYAETGSFGSLVESQTAYFCNG